MLSLCAGAVVAPVEAKVVSASLFKNGYAVLVREAPLANGETIISNIPQGALGTLWVTASPGVRLREVVGTSITSEQTSNAKSLDEIISANVGKTVRLRMGDKEVVGRILSATGSIVILESAQGVSAYAKGAVTSITAGKDLVWKTSVKTTSKAYRIRAEAPAGAKVYILALERGLTWAPAYAADITNPKLDLTSKATIMNDLADLNGIEVRLITGFPNMPFIGVLDPFTLSNSVDQFTMALMNMGAPGQFRDAPGALMQQNVAFGRMGESFSAAFDTSTMSGIQSEDLFFYTLPRLTLKKGERGYYVLFNFASDFEHLYEWSIPDDVQGDQYRPQQTERPAEVWHSLKFKNNSKQPLTTAAAITTKDGEILGQDILTYTSPGAETTLKITKALDVAAESLEEEVGRERRSLPYGGVGNYPFDEITLKGTISVRNHKSEAIKLRITKLLSGELVSADHDPMIVKMAKGLRAVNPRVRLVWTVDVPAGQKKDVIYQYKVLIRT
ncbi:MAG TPA: hypothetical protein VM328_09765 [Fimbriimonadaceae bacterium]|nr:hypothetical protein [Fimbriimonadaceae bacterium]